MKKSKHGNPSGDWTPPKIKSVKEGTMGPKKIVSSYSTVCLVKGWRRRVFFFSHSSAPKKFTMDRKRRLLLWHEQVACQPDAFNVEIGVFIGTVSTSQLSFPFQSHTICQMINKSWCVDLAPSRNSVAQL